MVVICHPFLLLSAPRRTSLASRVSCLKSGVSILLHFPLLFNGKIPSIRNEEFPDFRETVIVSSSVSFWFSSDDRKYVHDKSSKTSNLKIYDISK